jgi:TolA-binding protein
MTLRIKEATVKIEPERDERAGPARVFARKAEVTMRAAGDERPFGNLTINPLKELRTFDLAVEKDFAGLGGSVIQGIYQWEGEVLKLGLNDQSFGDRPARFDWVAILTRDSKEEREAAAELAKVLPFENADSKAQCQAIIRTHPKTAAAMIAQDYLEYGLVSEQELQDSKEPARLLELAKKGPKEKARETYTDILKRYPGTKVAEQASKLRGEMDEPDADWQLQLAIKLAKVGKKEEAKQGYLNIIDSYPETQGAKKAENLLNDLEAGMRLELAQELAKNGWKEKACQNSKEIIRLYAGTAAAGKAKELIVGIRLESAQKLAKDGLKLKACGLCKDTIRLYPNTESAKKCQELLQEWTSDLEAAWKLNLARLLAMDGLKLDREDLKEKAIYRCTEIIEKYPKTKAATQARALLEKLSK